MDTAATPRIEAPTGLLESYRRLRYFQERLRTLQRRLDSARVYPQSGTRSGAGQPGVSPARLASLEGITDRYPERLARDGRAQPPGPFVPDGVDLAADPRRGVPTPSALAKTTSRCVAKRTPADE